MEKNTNKKKSPRKLTLNRETLRRLSHEGGPAECSNTCGCTVSMCPCQPDNEL